MKALTAEKTMTTKEVAQALGITARSVIRAAKKCLSNKVIEIGKPTLWTEKDLTILLDYMKANNNRTDLTSTTGCLGSAETSFSLSLEIEKATAIVEQANAHLHNLLKQQIARLQTENNALQIELDSSKEWASVKRMESLNPNRKFNWRTLKAKSTEMGIEIRKVIDANYGEVNSYHKSVWEECYELDACPWD